jgi:hypothetical protein
MSDAMKLGFTGTRQQPTDAQLRAFIRLLVELKPTVFHHGDCVGADAYAHGLVRKACPDCRIIVHPPVEPNLRYYAAGDEVLAPKTYFARNRDIVDASECVVGMPAYDCERFADGKGGTYYTLAYAEKSLDKRIIVVLPDGKLKYQWPVK